MSSTPQLWIDACTKAHQRLLNVARDLTDAQARGPSLLPDWTAGHLLTHLARNADANTGMAEAAQRGEVAPMYPGGQAQREADIASGHGRPAAELVADLKDAIQRLERAWSATAEEAWATGLGRAFGGLRAIGFTVLMRWREVEVHLADLGLTELGSPDWDHLSPAYIDVEWAEQIATLGRRLPEGTSVLLIPGDRPSRVFGAGDKPIEVRATPGRILQYLMGRGGAQPGWPTLSPWS